MFFLRSALKTGGTFLCSISLGMAFEIQDKIILDLGSPQFRQRETAQADLLALARVQPLTSLETLYKESSSSDDPEVRQRLMSVLRALIDEQYSRQGKGYIGIGLKPVVANVPGEPKPRSLINVTQVQPNSPGERAGLKVNDLIVSLNGSTWGDETSHEEFSRKIAEMKPDATVQLKVLRDQKLLDLEVTLTRRPVVADFPYFDPRSMDSEGPERAAKEAHFRQWMSDKKNR